MGAARVEVPIYRRVDTHSAGSRHSLPDCERNNGRAANRIAAVRQALANAEQASGGQRGTALTQLASQLDGDAGSARDGAKVRMLATAVRSLAVAP